MIPGHDPRRGAIAALFLAVAVVVVVWALVQGAEAASTLLDGLDR